jgi:hypothetical protein
LKPQGLPVDTMVRRADPVGSARRILPLGGFDPTVPLHGWARRVVRPEAPSGSARWPPGRRADHLVSKEAGSSASTEQNATTRPATGGGGARARRGRLPGGTPSHRGDPVRSRAREGQGKRRPRGRSRAQGKDANLREGGTRAGRGSEGPHRWPSGPRGSARRFSLVLRRVGRDPPDRQTIVEGSRERSRRRYCHPPGTRTPRAAPHPPARAREALDGRKRDSSRIRFEACDRPLRPRVGNICARRGRVKVERVQPVERVTRNRVEKVST